MPVVMLAQLVVLASFVVFFGGLVRTGGGELS
jgi:hypothetical protein